MSKTGAFNDKTKRLIVDRSAGRCELCGTPASRAQFHHRNPRRMGGTSREEIGTAANALYLHPACHERVERNRTDAYENGWLLTANDDPVQKPVRLWDGWVLLAADGSMTKVDGP